MEQCARLTGACTTAAREGAQSHGERPHRPYPARKKASPQACRRRAGVYSLLPDRLRLFFARGCHDSRSAFAAEPWPHQRAGRYVTPPCADALGGCCIEADAFLPFSLRALQPRAINSLRRAGTGLFSPARLRHACGLGNCAREMVCDGVLRGSSARPRCSAHAPVRRAHCSVLSAPLPPPSPRAPCTLLPTPFAR